MKNSITAILITLNEEENIEKCLQSIAWVNEIIIVDSGSTDRTEEISKKYTNNFFYSEWDGFGRQKQKALDKSTSDWVLSIDADEVITEELRDEIIKIISSENSSTGYKIPRRSFYMGKFIKHCGWYPDYVTRLALRNDCFFSEDIVHERLILSNGNVGFCKFNIEHFPFKSINHHIEKINKYSELSAIKMFENNQEVSWLKILITPFFGFFRAFFLRLGFLDGWQGLTISLSTGFIGFLKYLKLKEMNLKKHNNTK